MIGIVNSIVPSRLTTAEYDLFVDDPANGAPSLDVEERDR